MVLCLCLSCLCALMCYTYIVESCTVGNESPQWDTLKTGLNGGLFIYVSSSENEQNVVITDSIRNLVTVIRDPSSLGRPQVPLLSQAERKPRGGRRAGGVVPRRSPFATARAGCPVRVFSVRLCITLVRDVK